MGLADMTTDRELLTAMRDGREEAVERIYRTHRPTFLAWAERRYDVPRQVLLDVYQDAVIILYQNVVEEKVTELRSSVKTYLFGIAKYLILKHFRDQRRLHAGDEEIAEIPVAPRYLEQVEHDDRRDRVRTALNALPPNCRQLIEYFYYYDFSLEAIAERMRYKNANTVKAQKHRCMKTLEELLRPKP